jgi:glycosyltransferase involved in cell wall biosynthesis
MLEMLRAWPEASLVLRGPAPEATRSLIASTCGDLLQSGRLTLDTGYLNDDELGSFLATFDIGLCLYDLSGSLRRDFNYMSAPSGKMFNYFAAGLPVLGSNIQGLSPVVRHDAGLLVEGNEAAALVEAGRRIMTRHAGFQAGALRAAEAFDFHASATLLADVLRGDRPP